MSSVRCKNTATVKDVARLMRFNLKCLNEAEFMTCDLDQVTEKYQDLLADVLAKTPRPTPALMRQAAMEAFECDQQLAHAFAERLVAAISHCRVKAKSATSGKKTGSRSEEDSCAPE